MDPDDTLLANVLRRLMNELYSFHAPYDAGPSPQYGPPGPRPGSIGLDGGTTLSQEEHDAIVRTGLVDWWIELEAERRG